MTETSPLCSLALPPRGTPARRGDRVAVQDGQGGSRRRSAGGRRGRLDPAQRRRVGRRVRGPGPVDLRLLLPRPGPRALPRRLAADRRHRVARPSGLHADQRPDQGRDQVGRRVDLVGRAGERGDGPSRAWSRPRSSPCPTNGGASGPWWRWSSRTDSSVTADELVEFLSGRVSRWWLPERWAFVAEVPKTSVGKFDKKVLRSQHAAGELDVVEIEIKTGR